uniref:AAA+ ATPase domain-containing protein n=1 Tax=Oryza punctata TaxID=4537 RepID=A0A0E0LLC2_ORYPU
MDSSAYGRKAVDAYRRALGTAASAAAYAVLARSMARELLPDELRAAARWGASQVSARLGWGSRERRTLVVRRHAGDGGGGGGDRDSNLLFDAARTYLASRLDPRAVRRLGLTVSKAWDGDGSRDGWRARLFIEPGDSTTDLFDGVEFTWQSVPLPAGEKKTTKGGQPGGDHEFLLELSFDAEHTAMAMERYVPFVMETAKETQRRERGLKICMNEGRMWYNINHHHPATFDTLAMDPDLKQSIVADLDLFTRRRDHYRRIGKAWKRGYLLHGPPGTGKSSLVAAMANHLRYNLYDLDLSHASSNLTLQWLLLAMPNRSILVIEDIDCCCDAVAREADTTKTPPPPPPQPPATQDEDEDNHADSSDSPRRNAPAKHKPNENQANFTNTSTMIIFLMLQVTLSGLLNFIDGLWSTSSDERVIVFTTNYRDRLDAALLRPGRMDMHIYMGYCGWDAFKTLAHNYFLVDDHPLFPEIRELLAGVEVTPAEVSEMLLRCDDADVALRGLTELLKEKEKKQARRDGQQQ